MRMGGTIRTGTNRIKEVEIMLRHWYDSYKEGQYDSYKALVRFVQEEYDSYKSSGVENDKGMCTNGSYTYVFAWVCMACTIRTYLYDSYNSCRIRTLTRFIVPGRF